MSLHLSIVCSATPVFSSIRHTRELPPFREKQGHLRTWHKICGIIFTAVPLRLLSMSFREKLDSGRMTGLKVLQQCMENASSCTLKHHHLFVYAAYHCHNLVKIYIYISCRQKWPKHIMSLRRAMKLWSSYPHPVMYYHTWFMLCWGFMHTGQVLYQVNYILSIYKNILN